jgi:hypothetical protein
MDVLAHQRSPAAVTATVTVGRQCPHAATQQHALELLDVGDWRDHRWLRISTSMARLLPSEQELQEIRLE